MGSDIKSSDNGKALVSRDPLIVRDRILCAAQAEFMRVGYERANTNAMASNFGISKATIFRHFPTKRDLFEAVVDRIAGRWREDIALENFTGTTPHDWLTEFGIKMLHWILRDEAIFVGRMAISEGPDYQEVRNLWPKVAGEPIERMLMDRFAVWLDAGLVRGHSARQMAVAFLDLTLAGQVSRVMYGAERSEVLRGIEDHVRNCVDIFVQGVASDR